MIQEYVEYFKVSRPSFKRFKRRWEKDFGETPDRNKYLEIKAAIKAEDIHTLEDLFFAYDVKQRDYDVTKLTINRWADNKQIKAELTPKFKPIEQPFRRSGFRLDVPVPIPTKAAGDVLILPDSQNGFIKLNGKLIPTHSRNAWAQAISLAAAIQPAHIVLLGDMVDLPAFSKYRQSEATRYVTQQALDETWYLLAQLRSASPNSQIHYIYGNHEARYENSLTDFNDEYVGLRRANSGPRVNSLEYLLRLDELGVNVIAPYKESLYLNDVEFTHGTKVGAGSGATVTKVIKDVEHNIVFGHVHRVELAYKTVHRIGGITEDVYAFCAGCMCDPRTTPPTPAKDRNWQVSLAYLSGKGAVPELIQVLDDYAVWRGIKYLPAKLQFPIA